MPRYWVKIDCNGTPSTAECDIDDDIDTLKEKIQAKFAPMFNLVPIVKIVVKNTDGEILSPLETLGDRLLIDNCHFIVNVPLNLIESKNSRIMNPAQYFFVAIS